MREHEVLIYLVDDACFPFFVLREDSILLFGDGNAIIVDRLHVISVGVGGHGNVAVSYPSLMFLIYIDLLYFISADSTQIGYQPSILLDCNSFIIDFTLSCGMFTALIL